MELIYFFEMSYSDNFTCCLCNVSWRRPETTSALVLSPPRNGQLLQELVVNHFANQAVNVTCPNSTCISERAITPKEPTHIANTVILLIARYMFVAGNRVYSRAEVTIGSRLLSAHLQCLASLKFPLTFAINLF